jgi:hypothetical protein
MGKALKTCVLCSKKNDESVCKTCIHILLGGFLAVLPLVFIIYPLYDFFSKSSKIPLYPSLSPLLSPIIAIIIILIRIIRGWGVTGLAVKIITLIPLIFIASIVYLTRTWTMKVWSIVVFYFADQPNKDTIDVHGYISSVGAASGFLPIVMTVFLMMLPFIIALTFLIWYSRAIVPMLKKTLKLDRFLVARKKTR